MDNHTKLATTLLSERGVTLLDAARLIRNALDSFSKESGLTPVQFCAKVISTASDIYAMMRCLSKMGFYYTWKLSMTCVQTLYGIFAIWAIAS